MAGTVRVHIPEIFREQFLGINVPLDGIREELPGVVAGVVRIKHALVGERKIGSEYDIIKRGCSIMRCFPRHGGEADCAEFLKCSRQTGLDPVRGILGHGCIGHDVRVGIENDPKKLIVVCADAAVGIGDIRVLMGVAVHDQLAPFAHEVPQRVDEIGLL